MRFWRWIGHSGTKAVMAAQFGFEMMPLCFLIRRALISGITSGTSVSIRKAEELSTTTAPALTAMGANFFEMLPPAENSAMSTPSKDVSTNSSMTIFWPRKSTVFPAERALASARKVPTGKLRRSMQPRNSAPTAPVAPTTAIVGLCLILFSMGTGNKKAPDLSAGLRFERCDLCVTRARPPKPRWASSSSSCA